MIKNANFFPKWYTSLHHFSEAYLITWKMKQGLMIQSLQPIIFPHKNEVPRGAELLFGLQKEG